MHTVIKYLYLAISEASRFLYYLTSRWSMKTWHFHNSLGYKQCLLPYSLKDLGVFHTSLIIFLSYRSKRHGQGSTSIHILGIIASLLHLQERKALETASQERWSQFISANSFVYCGVCYTSLCSVERVNEQTDTEEHTVHAKGGYMRLWT